MEETQAQIIERVRGYSDLVLLRLLRRHFGNCRSGTLAERDMPEVRAVEDEADRREREPVEVTQVGEAVDTALAAARAVVVTDPASGRCRSIIITKLEEAQHRARELPTG